ncbi:MAG: 4Fe-4S binding protein [Saccharolobus sp.]|uniref:4Fe-4S binding protein n=1 Tax=Saccharolobus sp. TaxID=2100761 RepID=UPI00316708EB
MLRFNTGLIISRRAREYLGDELLKEIFNLGQLSYLAEYGDYVTNDIIQNNLQSLLIVHEKESEDSKEITNFLRDLDQVTGINPLAVEEIYTEWFQSREQAKALILAYIEKLALSFLTQRVQPVRTKKLSRRSLLRGKLYYYKPYPILYQEINFEREMNYLTSLCPLIMKTPEGPQVSNPEECSTCGFCSGMSFLGYLEIPNFSTDQIVAFINSLVKYAPRDKPSVILISCKKLERIPDANVYVYPLLAPCIASVHDSFLTAIFAAGFYPVIYSPQDECELRDMARLRAETMIKKFPGTNIFFPYVENESELSTVLNSNMENLPRHEIPPDIVFSRSRRRSLLLWSIQEVNKIRKLDGFDKIPGVFKVTVDPSKCVLCGVCVRSCQMLVFNIKNSNDSTNLYYDLSYCIGSQRCIRNCPENAIKLEGYLEVKELGEKLVASSKIVKCRFCGKPLDSFRIKSKVDELLIQMGIADVSNYTDVCNECKQKMLAKKWVEKVIGK